MAYRWKGTSSKEIDSSCFKEYKSMMFDGKLMKIIDVKSEMKKYKNIKFSESVFEEDVIFDSYEFEGDVIFENTVFNGIVSFKNCIFHGDCIFINVKFSNQCKNNKIFMKSKVKGQYFVLKNIKNIPRLDGIIFSNCSKLVLEDLFFKKEEYEYAKFVYRVARNQANSIGDYERVGHYYYLERYYGGKNIKKENFNNTKEYMSNKCFDLLSKYTIGYGEKPFNIFIISFFIISIFALLYMFTGIRSLDNEIIEISLSGQFDIENLLKSYMDLWYFSMATFSTVGYGDMVVTTAMGKILASIEVFIGVTMAASWASVIIKRMSR